MAAIPARDHSIATSMEEQYFRFREKSKPVRASLPHRHSYINPLRLRTSSLHPQFPRIQHRHLENCMDFHLHVTWPAVGGTEVVECGCYGVTAHVLFALAEVGLEIESARLPFPLFGTFQLLGFDADWIRISHGGEGPNDLNLDRYCNLLALDLDKIMVLPRAGKVTESIASSSSTTISLMAGHGREIFGDLVDVEVEEEAV
ncbi:hypothetical protein BKA65DRAFT_490271 [Rhexocercosporidium sp. MPI-PUGE-AT-0058]|nr:hypothetical protein BKA65DRAFT_490271 [Rhexocercosporidium sp. MPI-PUGE-AT-0058]